MKYVLVVLVTLLISGCDTYDKVKDYPELAKKVKELEEENKRLEGVLEGVLEKQQKNSKIFKSLLSSDPKYQVKD